MATKHDACVAALRWIKGTKGSVTGQPEKTHQRVRSPRQVRPARCIRMSSEMYATLDNHHAKRMPQYRIGVIMNTNTKTEIMVIACTAAP